MTDQLAKEIFNVLLEQLTENGFSDVFTFALVNPWKETADSPKFEDDSPQSTESEMAIIMAESEDEPLDALKKLIDCTRAYFAKALSIPGRYSQVIRQLVGEGSMDVDTNIYITTFNEKTINASTTLQQIEIYRIQELLNFIDEYKNWDDYEFLERLQLYLNQTS